MAFFRKRHTAAEALEHKWLSQDVKFMRAKRLSTEKHKRYMAKRKWQVSPDENPLHFMSSFSTSENRQRHAGPRQDVHRAEVTGGRTQLAVHQITNQLDELRLGGLLQLGGHAQPSPVPGLVSREKVV
jgi:hypothetical protein